MCSETFLRLNYIETLKGIKNTIELNSIRSVPKKNASNYGFNGNAYWHLFTSELNWDTSGHKNNTKNASSSMVSIVRFFATISVSMKNDYVKVDKIQQLRNNQSIGIESSCD